MASPEQPVLGSDGLPVRSTGPWVHDKNYYLKRYLDIFTRGIGPKWKGKLAYVDLFSGPGRSIIRGKEEEVEGSPFLALQFDFAHYTFVDVPEVLATLKERLTAHSKRSRITFIQGDCNAVVEQVREAVPADHLTLAFVDPTGLQIRFSTISGLVENRKIDLLMTIQFGMGIRMNLQQYTNAEEAALTRFLGDDSWRQDVQQNGSPSQIGRRILNRYLANLGKLGFTTVRDREIDIRSDQNNLLLYFMVLASRHSRGEDFWRKITDIQASGQRFLFPSDD